MPQTAFYGYGDGATWNTRAVDTASAALELDLPATVENVGRARRAVCAHLAGTAVAVDDVAVVVSEAITNVVLHAYRDRETLGRVRVRVAVTDDCVEVEVCDGGVGMTPRPDSPGMGLGLPLMRRLSASMDIDSSNGTRLRLRFERQAR